MTILTGNWERFNDRLMEYAINHERKNVTERHIIIYKLYIETDDDERFFLCKVEPYVGEAFIKLASIDGRYVGMPLSRVVAYYYEEMQIAIDRPTGGLVLTLSE